MTHPNIMKKIEETSQYLRNLKVLSSDIVFVLGSGLSELIESIDSAINIPYKDIPHFPESTVHSHKGELIHGTLYNKKISVLSGRFHYYEGYNMSDIVFPLRVLMYLGTKLIVLTNAAGGVNNDFKTGDLMLIKDHINLLPDNPLRGKNIDELGIRFPGMLNAYSIEYRNIVKNIAKEKNIKLHEGVYCALQGPSLETNAEYNMIRILGADAVGMSTVPEVIAAKHMNIDVIAFSIITNIANDYEKEHITHEEVVKNANIAGIKLKQIIYEFVKRIELK